MSYIGEAITFIKSLCIPVQFEKIFFLTPTPITLLSYEKVNVYTGLKRRKLSYCQITFDQFVSQLRHLIKKDYLTVSRAFLNHMSTYQFKPLNI